MRASLSSALSLIPAFSVYTLHYKSVTINNAIQLTQHYCGNPHKAGALTPSLERANEKPRSKKHL